MAGQIEGQGDGVSDPNKGGAESGGGAWKGNNDKPAHPDERVVTHIERETEDARDDDETRSKP